MRKRKINFIFLSLIVFSLLISTVSASTGGAVDVQVTISNATVTPTGGGGGSSSTVAGIYASLYGVSSELISVQIDEGEKQTVSFDIYNDHNYDITATIEINGIQRQVEIPKGGKSEVKVIIIGTGEEQTIQANVWVKNKLSEDPDKIVKIEVLPEELLMPTLSLAGAKGFEETISPQVMVVIGIGAVSYFLIKV